MKTCARNTRVCSSSPSIVRPDTAAVVAIYLSMLISGGTEVVRTIILWRRKMTLKKLVENIPIG